MMAARVVGKIEQENVSVQIVAITEATDGQKLTLLQVTNIRYVHPLRIENYPSLMKVWSENEDDDIFASGL